MFYYFIRLLTLPFAFLPLRAIHKVGRCFGTIAYVAIPKFRKRALSNLALASDLALSNKEIYTIAREAMQSLMITCLEYSKLAREKDIQKVVTCDNKDEAAAFIEKGQGVVFFCGHQANWELLFLEGTHRMPGLAIGRPIKDRRLYEWVLSIRQRYGGTIVTPKHAIKEGLRALRRGAFLGVVGDQGMPDSGFSCPFLGREAWTSPMPALLAVRTASPLFVATTSRENGRYRIHYSAPIFPDPKKPAEEEVNRLMRSALSLFENSIKARPGQWLWQHNRWKQQSLDVIKRPYRHDAIAVVIPKDKPHLAKQLKCFKEVYPREFLAAFVDAPIAVAGMEILPLDDVFKPDLRFKLIFNFTGDKTIDRHFKKLAGLEVVSLERLKKESGIEDEEDLPSMVKKAVCRAR